MSSYLRSLAQVRPQITLPGLSSQPFQVIRLTGSEQVSGMYSFDIDISPLDEVNFDEVYPDRSLVGDTALVTLNADEGGTRHIQGIIDCLATVPEEESQSSYAYRLRLVPWLELLDLRSNCRIFEDQTAVDVIRRVCEDAGKTFQDYTRESYDPLEYCTQFAETDLNFVLRLLEREGIFFFFTHTESGHTLVLADKNSSFPDVEGPPRATHGYSVTHWRMEQVLRSQNSYVRDYEYQSGREYEAREQSLVSDAPGQDLQIYHYPGGFRDSTGARRQARIGIQREETKHLVFSGRSIRPDFTAGARVELQGHPVDQMNGRYILTRVDHSWDLSRGYFNRFTCIPDNSSMPIRPPRGAARPAMPGPQTATVVDTNDEQHLGRAKVRFHWATDESGECFVRVAELLAGREHGTWFVPRVGDEVVVDFVNGDPDRPIITGRVYNGRNLPQEANPDVNAIHTSHGQSVRFDAEEIIVTNDQGCRLRIGNDGDISVVSSGGTEIEITANGEIKMTAPTSVDINASQITMSAGAVNIDSALLKTSGVVQCSTLISNSVVSAMYSPGAGNIW